MNEIPVGTTGEQPLLVTPEWAIDFLGDKAARVLSTPHLILWLEITARNAVKPYLAEGYESIGTEVHVRHLAPTPVGMSVRFTARVTAVEGARVRFDLVARDEREIVAEGTHERFIINVPPFVTKLAAKLAARETSL
jgi:fluoroacetyl-CoA thioesterase